MLKTTTRQNLGNASYLGATGSIPLVIAKSAIPFIKTSSGTMGNNGALSAITALPVTYANAYLWFTANQIAAGVAAGWYFTQMSSTTAGTVFNNTYTTGIPTIPSSPAAFSTTGPGAFTGDTAEDFALQFAVAANSMGANGQLRFSYITDQTNNVNAKTIRVRFSGTGGTIESSNSVATVSSNSTVGFIANRGLTNSQFGGHISSTAATSVFTAVSTIDTTAATTVVFSMQGATATDNIVLEVASLELIPG